jgi:tRNA threonylcarbamoyladenosine biosynthesis protein TsaB
MRVLALETSTDDGSCALWCDGDVRLARCPAGRPHSETLLPLVRQLMEEAGIAFPQLDAIAFGSGPGAFTGLRIACGLAQGLAIAAGVPLVPVGSLMALADAGNAPRVLALLDARMGEVYAATFIRDAAGMLSAATDAAVAPPVAVAIPAGTGWVACGNAPAVYPLLAERLLAAGIAWPGPATPAADAVARLAAKQLARGEPGIDPAVAAPLYVRDKVAQTVAERLGAGGRA